MWGDWQHRLVRHRCCLWGGCLDIAFGSLCSSFFSRCLQGTISFLRPFSVRQSCPQAWKHHTDCRTASLDEPHSDRKSSSLPCFIFHFSGLSESQGIMEAGGTRAGEYDDNFGNEFSIAGILRLQSRLKNSSCFMAFSRFVSCVLWQIKSLVIFMWVVKLTVIQRWNAYCKWTTSTENTFHLGFIWAKFI